jgi:hypothetical protein
MTQAERSAIDTDLMALVSIAFLHERFVQARMN